MGWSKLTKCRALKVRHLVSETDTLIEIKNKEKIMKNLVADSIKYSTMSSFTYLSHPTKTNGISYLNIISVLIDNAGGENKEKK